MAALLALAAAAALAVAVVYIPSRLFGCIAGQIVKFLKEESTR